MFYSRIPESEFIRRVLLNPAIEDEKKAKVFYLKLWTLVVDARTKQRTEKTAVSATEAHRRKMKEKSKSDDNARSVTNKSTAAVRNRSVVCFRPFSLELLEEANPVNWRFLYGRSALSCVIFGFASNNNCIFVDAGLSCLRECSLFGLYFELNNSTHGGSFICWV